MLHRVFFILYSSVSLYLVSGAICDRAYSQTNWRDLTSADLPARVDSIVFASGNTLTRSESLSWGRWNVALTDKTNAYFGQVGDPSLKVIGINSLLCSNEVSGKANCIMRFDRLDGRWTCNIFIDGYDRIQINCPNDLRLR